MAGIGGSDVRLMNWHKGGSGSPLLSCTINSVATHPMTDFHNISLDAYEREQDRYAILDLPAIREYIQEHAGCSVDDALEWFEQVSGRPVAEDQWSAIEEVWEEESADWDPSDDEMKSAFGTKWHDWL